MASKINADTSAGLKLTSDTSGDLELQSASTTVATVDSDGITMASGKVLSGDIDVDKIILGEVGAISQDVNSLYSGANFTGSSGDNRYQKTGNYAIKQTYDSATGSIKFAVAPTGTKGNTITWVDAMQIENTGNIRFKNNLENSSHGVNISPSSDDRDSIDCKTSSTGQVGLIHFYNPNGLVGYIASNGTSTQYITSSDYRLKENVVPLTGSIDRLKELKPSKFNFIADAETTVDGFLAHEAQEVVPEAVVGTKNAMCTEEYEVTPAVLDDNSNTITAAVMGTREVPDYQGIDQSKLVPLLTSALQEAITKIEDLETRIQALENA